MSLVPVYGTSLQVAHFRCGHPIEGNTRRNNQRPLGVSCATCQNVRQARYKARHRDELNARARQQYVRSVQEHGPRKRVRHSLPDVLPPDDAFWAKVDKSGDCWLWTGALTGPGYGHVFRFGRFLQAHRYAYGLVLGPIPDGLVLDHLCRVPRCVNPSHLEPVTNQVNCQRGLRGDLRLQAVSP